MRSEYRALASQMDSTMLESEGWYSDQKIAWPSTVYPKNIIQLKYPQVLYD